MATSEPPLSPAVGVLLLLLMASGLVVWIAVVRRLARRRPVVPWQARRPVPWDGLHVTILVLLYAGLQVSLPPLVAYTWRPPWPVAAGAVKSPAKDAGAKDAAPDHAQQPEPDTEHIVGRLLRDSPGPAAALLCLATAGLLAPWCEEVLFRLVLQGWLEKQELAVRRRWRAWRRLLPGLVPVGLVALLFAAIHFRTAEPNIDVRTAARFLIGAGLANLLTLAAGLTLLKLDAGATAADLGVVPQRLKSDIGTGILAYLAIALVLFPLQAGLSNVLPKTMAPDPVSLFPFALLVGWLYYRTHRIVPSIVVHMGLNCTSLLVAWLQAAPVR